MPLSHAYYLLLTMCDYYLSGHFYIHHQINIIRPRHHHHHRNHHQKILGVRANQINNGCKSFIETTDSDIDGYLIAEQELYQKKNPFIIKRPLPSGINEYWYVNDLEFI